jgi:hypothetical protein
MPSSDGYVRRRLALLLIELGDIEGLYDLAVYSRKAARELVELLARKGEVDELLRQVVCGNGFANRALTSGWRIAGLTDAYRARILRDGLNPDGSVAPHR